MYVSDRYSPNNIGGAERIVQLEANSWATNAGAAVFTTYGSGADPVWGKRNADGVTEYRSVHCDPSWAESRNRLGRSVGLWRQTIHDGVVADELARAIADFRPDIIHAHHISRLSYSAVARQPLRKLLTFHDYHYECLRGGLVRPGGDICDTHCFSCRAYSVRVAPTIAKFDTIVAISSFIEERLKRQLPSVRVRHLPNGLPREDRNDHELAVGEPPQPGLRLLGVGRLEPNKCLFELAKAFLRWDRPSWSLTIVGTGSQLSQLQSLADAHENVVARGQLSGHGVRQAMLNADVVLVPSKWHEVLNTVVREAQSLGRAVIATDVGGNRDMITNAKDGYLVGLAEGNPDWNAFQRILHDLDHNRADLSALGSNARQASRSYDLESHMECLRGLYAEVLDERT